MEWAVDHTSFPAEPSCSWSKGYPSQLWIQPVLGRKPARAHSGGGEDSLSQ